MNPRQTVLVTGATGYIGGRLIPRLLELGLNIRVLVRDRTRVEGRGWSSQVEVFEGDLSDQTSLQGLFEGVSQAFYLVHSLYHGAGFDELEYRCASNFVEAAGPDLRLCVYLGGLLPDRSEHISLHLDSRAQVGEILAAKLPVTEFRAGPIIGSGSASFEMVRYLTERLPIMVAPKWVNNKVQPINVRAVLDYLVASLEKPALGVIDIGGEVLTFKEMMLQYAQVRGLSRTIIPLPVLAPELAALWVGLVTPIPNSLARPLVQGIVSPVLANLEQALKNFPGVAPFSYKNSVELAFVRIAERAVETRWSSSSAGYNWSRMVDQEGTFREVRSVFVPAKQEAVFSSFSSIGGDRGWLVWNWAWNLRGFLDQLVGGPGLRRGRRHPSELLPGEALDFWRVERVEPPKRLVLCAEMKVPGSAWLAWEAIPVEGGTQLVQTALFHPRGLFGFLYWYAMFPFHRFIFSDLCQTIAQDAVNLFSHPRALRSATDDQQGLAR